jgi:hypothetical protein
MAFVQGRYKPHNPKKYRGDPTDIVYRSGWELKFMLSLDSHPDILEWASESVIIPYRSPVDNSLHRYFVDFYVKKKTKSGDIVTELIEIKPEKQRLEPVKKSKKPTKKYIREVMTYGVNQAKWKAAEEYCRKKGWQFRVMSEHDLGIK